MSRTVNIEQPFSCLSNSSSSVYESVDIQALRHKAQLAFENSNNRSQRHQIKPSRSVKSSGRNADRVKSRTQQSEERNLIGFKESLLSLT